METRRVWSIRRYLGIGRGGKLTLAHQLHQLLLERRVAVARATGDGPGGLSCNSPGEDFPPEGAVELKQVLDVLAAVHMAQRDDAARRCAADEVEQLSNLVGSGSEC